LKKYAKVIKIHRIFYYESYIDLGSESVGFDDAEKKHHWREIQSDDDVQYLFRTIEDDPSVYFDKPSASKPSQVLAIPPT
jgi:hypothetical protein